MAKQYTADQVAQYLLSLVEPDDNDVSNLKLQKLCYYAQGVGVAARDEPLFPERIYAWDHGPVVTTLYHNLKGHGGQPIPSAEEFDSEILDEADRQFLDDIYSYYGQFSAWRLRNMTHEEKPWQDAYKSEDKEITIDALKEFFGPQVKDEYKDSVHGKIQAT